MKTKLRTKFRFQDYHYLLIHPSSIFFVPYQSPPRGAIFTGWYPRICIYRVSPESRTVNAYYALVAIPSPPTSSLPVDTRRVLALLFLATKAPAYLSEETRAHKSTVEKGERRERRALLLSSLLSELARELVNFCVVPLQERNSSKPTGLGANRPRRK